jgi:hypothetical protein
MVCFLDRLIVLQIVTGDSSIRSSKTKKKRVSFFFEEKSEADQKTTINKQRHSDVEHQQNGAMSNVTADSAVGPLQLPDLPSGTAIVTLISQGSYST